MSRTGTDDAKHFAQTGRDRMLDGAAPEPAWLFSVTECQHSNLNHDKSRCLDCGAWAHHLVSVPTAAGASQ